MRKLILLLALAPSLFAETYTRNVAIVIFEGVEILDLAAPAQLFAVAAQFGARGNVPAYRVYTVGSTRASIASQGFIDITPDFAIDDAPAPDILVIPGGRADNAMADAALMQWMKTAAAQSDRVLTICYGSFIAGKLGLLNGLEATTWYGSVDRLGAELPKTRVRRGVRFVDNGKVITSAGVSAGLDGALHLIARDLGRAIADRTAQHLEYTWTPQAHDAAAYVRCTKRGLRCEDASLR